MAIEHEPRLLGDLQPFLVGTTQYIDRRESLVLPQSNLTVLREFERRGKRARDRRSREIIIPPFPREERSELDPIDGVADHPPQPQKRFVDGDDSPPLEMQR